MSVMPLNGEDEGVRYERLIATHGVLSLASLSCGPIRREDVDRGRGLFAKQHISQGDAALVVPCELCLFHEVEVGGFGLGGADSADAYDFDKNRVAWKSEMVLTKEFMILLHHAAAEGTGFWADYWWLLPNVDCKIPCNISRSAVEDMVLVDARLSSAILAQRANLRGECPATCLECAVMRY